MDDLSAQVLDQVRAKPARWRRLLRPQFSLKTLLLLAVICALLVALWTSSWTSSHRLEQAKAEIELYRAEVAKYRRELGYLDITDPDKVHAIGVRTVGSFRWQWRVYIPKNRRFRLYASTSAIPQFGFKTGASKSSHIPSGEFLVPSGEFLLDAYVEQARDGRWIFSTKHASGANWIGIDAKDVPWVQKEGSWSGEHVCPEEVKVVEPGESLLLVRLRVVRPTKVASDGKVLEAHEDDPSPCDGLMLWIKEVK